MPQSVKNVKENFQGYDGADSIVDDCRDDQRQSKFGIYYDHNLMASKILGYYLEGVDIYSLLFDCLRDLRYNIHCGDEVAKEVFTAIFNKIIGFNYEEKEAPFTYQNLDEFMVDCGYKDSYSVSDVAYALSDKIITKTAVKVASKK